MKKDLLKHVEVNPNVMLGKPVIKGTRITVEQILRKLAGKVELAQILEDYPQLTEQDVQAAILFAAEALSTEELIPLS